MTASLAKARGFATAVKGMFGWQATCPTCRWSQPPDLRRYQGEASFSARAHNAEHHPEARK